MTADKPKAPERIWLLRVDALHHVKADRPVPINAWDFGGECDIEYTRSDLYPATPEVIGETSPLLRDLRSLLYSTTQRYPTIFVSHKDVLELMRRIDRALAALTAKEPR